MIVFAIALSPLFVKSKTAISRESYIFIIKFLLYFLVRRILVIFGLFDRLFVAEDFGKQESPTIIRKNTKKKKDDMSDDEEKRASEVRQNLSTAYTFEHEFTIFCLIRCSETVQRARLYFVLRGANL